MTIPKILVYGDAMLDIYVTGSVGRDSPEAPGVPVLSHGGMDCFPGGAANVAANIVALGGDAMALGTVGRDPSASVLEETLAAHGASMEFLVRDEGVTTTKTRFVAGGRQLLRLDMERAEPLSADNETELMFRIAKFAPQASAIVASDYAKGAMTPSIAAGLVRLGHLNGIPVIVDAKEPRAPHWKGATVIKPNLAETARALGRSLTTGDAIVDAALDLWGLCGATHLLVTMGSMGMMLVGEQGIVPIDPHRVKARDVTGAGDTVAAALALALASGEDIVAAAHFANAAAAVAVTKAGTARPTPEEVRFFYDRGSGVDRAAGRPVAGQAAANWLH